ncbi:uncharacterized protein HMPREF1541_03241 [Cyphellophora europaea CBS 101466]|uniref:Uncharacterized protein n=1 Tax=Cyphellophora europaea (strain CBS 101466) TaxID=1220924 RepID=W2RXR3_CYPE1|nr:uncharacterized protein HMPREF1541_03241 [Cyphellophora europaea CBS 101466]ETN41306.1 hypothetical protein HMPREF1541_03241 [Cyphellophora europaea CBS 101466]
MNSARRKSLLEVNTLARSARVKMVKECQRPDMDLRHVVGHANFLDHLKHLTLQAHLEVVTEAPAPKRHDTVQTSAKEVSDDDTDYSDDEAMAFESISYSSTNNSTVTVINDEDSDSNSDSSDSDDGESLSTCYLKSPSRPPPTPHSRSKPIDFPTSQIRVTAVEVI